MKQEILAKIKILKSRYEPEGFIILGIFGSVARGKTSRKSDIDILYRLEKPFLDKHIGWKSCVRIEQIQAECESFLKSSVDLADIDALDKVSRYFIIPEVVYVA